MNAAFGWALAAVFAVASWQAYSWAGVAFAASAIVFWLLLQFNRAVRVMKNAGENPIGEVPSAVMFHAGLQKGDTMLKIVTKSKSLGRKVEGSADDWTWSDAGGRSVRLHFVRGRLREWWIAPPGEPAAEPVPAPGPAT